MPIRLHEDAALFREAVNFTAARTRFAARLKGTAANRRDRRRSPNPAPRSVVRITGGACGVDSVPVAGRSDGGEAPGSLVRRDVAIRDFFDIDHAVRKLNLDVMDATFLGLVRAKLAVPDNGPVDVSPGRLAALRAQVNGQLRPVLLASDYADFDLDRAFGAVHGVAVAISQAG